MADASAVVEGPSTQADLLLLQREHSPRRAEVLHRALAMLRRTPHVAPLDLPADLATFPAELWAPLVVIHRLDDEPADADPARLANAVSAVVRWARHANAPHTAVALAVAGAELLVALPSLALLAGRAARAAGQPDEAERWLAAAMRRADAIGGRDARVAAARELVEVGRDVARREQVAAPVRRPGSPIAAVPA